MEKSQSNLKIVIVLLVIIILLLLGFGVFFLEEILDEREDIREIHDTNDRIYADSGSNVKNKEVNNNVNTTNTNNTTDSGSYISRDDALKSALEDSGITESDIRDLDIELENKYGQTVYEVTFDYNQYEYEYYINREDGSIVKSFIERD